MNIRIASNKTLHAGVVALTAIFALLVTAAVGLIFYAASDGSTWWGIVGAVATACIFTVPFFASYRENQELEEYYNKENV